MQDAPINISDVIEVIETDPDFVKAPMTKNMFNGGGEIQVVRAQPQQNRAAAYVKIIEQPAPKALRFRYECEGRSAGSIPGASSTPDNKTFPAIQVVGYRGKAVVVVSCVTKDHPYRPHPHNLVGREGCRKGVCTMQIPEDTMSVSFSNLGIQCVKKKDIEAALKVRQEIRVDPFHTKFDHMNQPAAIDLNAVRLCFQVFIEGDTPGRITHPLRPVVSEPIYDKKAMSDLSIVKLSDCVSYVDGGRKDIILVCEKVAKDDIQVRFFEETDGQVVWEAFADIQPSQVYKQHVIWFKTPRYRSLEVTQTVKCFIQLRRMSDGACSEPLPFELWPLDSGRPYWPYRRPMRKSNFALFNSILAEAKASKPQPETIVLDTPEEKPPEPFNDIAELDQIYSEAQARLLSTELTAVEKPPLVQQNESFDDAKTYSSLQLAFKNPLEIEFDRKREMDEKLPPLPPKRSKNIETYIGGSMNSIQLTGKQAENLLHRSNSSLKAVSRSQSFNMQRPKSVNDFAPKPLPPKPCSTLPNPKKRGFFSKLFGKKSASKESVVQNIPPKRESFSTKSLQVALGKSSGNLSTHSANSIRIPLKDSPTGSEVDVSVKENLDVEGNNQEMDLNLDLTEAEHYALYTAMAPHATQSEFDEMSCYYAPVEGGRLLTQAEVAARLMSKT